MKLSRTMIMGTMLALALQCPLMMPVEPLRTSLLQGGVIGPGRAWADEAWKKEFEDVCARAGDEEGLSRDDLKAPLARCDALKPVIEGLEESTRKVYLARLQACRDLYRYMLDAKGKGAER